MIRNDEKLKDTDHGSAGSGDWNQGFLIGKATDLLKAHILEKEVAYDFVVIWR